MISNLEARQAREALCYLDPSGSVAAQADEWVLQAALARIEKRQAQCGHERMSWCIEMQAFICLECEKVLC